MGAVAVQNLLTTGKELVEVMLPHFFSFKQVNVWVVKYAFISFSV